MYAPTSLRTYDPYYMFVVLMVTGSFCVVEMTMAMMAI